MPRRHGGDRHAAAACLTTFALDYRSNTDRCTPRRLLFHSNIHVYTGSIGHGNIHVYTGSIGHGNIHVCTGSVGRIRYMSWRPKHVVRACLYARLYTLLNACLYPGLHAYLYRCLYTYLYQCLHACLYRCLYTCLYPCLHACLYRMSIQTSVPMSSTKTSPWFILAAQGLTSTTCHMRICAHAYIHVCTHACAHICAHV